MSKDSPPAGDAGTAIEIQPVGDNLTLDAFLSKRLEAMAPAETPPGEPEAEEPEREEGEEEPDAAAKPPEEEGSGDEAAAESKVESVLSKLNLDELTEDEVNELRDALKSKAVGRYGELTAKRKAAEEEAARLRSEIERMQASKNPFQREDRPKNNPFKDIDTVDKLQAQWESFTQVEEWADSILDENDTAANDDIVTEYDGKELTKKQVKDYLRKARQSKEKFLPARFRELQEAQQIRAAKSAFEEQAKKDLPWMGKEDDPVRKEYDLVMADPRVKKVLESVPEIESQLGYLLAHSVNSMFPKLYPEKVKKGKEPVAAKAPASRIKPPPNPAAGGAPERETPDKAFDDRLKALESRFRESGSVEDFIALRAAKQAK